MLLKFFLTLSLEKGVFEVLLSFFDFPEFLNLVYEISGKSIVKLLLFSGCILKFSGAQTC